MKFKIDELFFKPEPKPVVEEIKKPTPKAETVNTSTISKLNDNNFAGNLLQTKFLRRFPAENGTPLPADPNNSQILSLVFDDKAVIKVDKLDQPDYRYDENTSGADAAKAILTQANGSNRVEDQTHYYLQLLEDHKSDPQWMAEFYKSLGPEATAKLISDTVTPTAFQHSQPEEVRQHLANVRESLSAMANSNPPLFTQEDMNALMNGLAKNPNGLDMVAMEIFGKMDHNSENLKNMFYKSASQLALSGTLDDKQSRFFASAAAHVLSHTSAQNQAEQLAALRGDTPAGAPSKLTEFINLAMRGLTETPSLESRLGTLSQYPGEHGPAVSEPYGRIDALLLNAAYAGVTDGHTPGPRLSTEEIKALQTELFQAAPTNLSDPKIEKAYQDSTLMKDGLSRIFMDNFSSIYKAGLGANGSGMTDALKKQMNLFFKYTVFTTQPGHQQQQLMDFIKTQVTGITAALNSTAPNAEQDFMNQFGMSRNDGAALLGNMLGSMRLGLDAHIKEVTADAEAKKKALGFLFDVTVGLIPGVGGKLTDEASSQLAKLIGKIADKSQSQIIDSIKNGSLDQAKEYFLKDGTAKDPATLLTVLKEEVNTSLPDGDNGTGNYHQTFQSAYTYTVTP